MTPKRWPSGVDRHGQEPTAWLGLIVEVSPTRRLILADGGSGICRRAEGVHLQHWHPASVHGALSPLLLAFDDVSEICGFFIHAGPDIAVGLSMSHSPCSDMETEPFLRSEKRAAAPLDVERGRCDDLHRCSAARSAAVSWRAVLLHLTLISLYTLAYLFAPRPTAPGFTLLQETIRGLDIRVRPTDYVVAGASPYAGGPTAAVDGAWHQLLGNISIRVTDDELARNGDRTESVQLPVGGGQMAWLGVFHQLHCLKKLRQLNYPQAYAPHLNDDQRWDQEVHVNHCIELLRQSVMCNPDTSLTTFSWARTKTRPVLNIGGFQRQCVDWEAFMTNVLPRVVDGAEVDALVNPNLAQAA